MNRRRLTKLCIAALGLIWVTAPQAQAQTKWNDLLSDPMAVFTFILAMFTILLCVISWRAAEDAKKSAQAAADSARISAEQLELSRASMVLIERPFVFLNEAALNPVLDNQNVRGFRADIQWTNSGKTPALNVRAYINSSIRSTPMPDDFDYPDQGDGIGHAAAIAPGGHLNSEGIFINLSSLQPVLAKTSFFYLWGHCEYDDLFPGTLRHRTRFCFQASLTLGQTLDALNAWFATHGTFNGIDDLPRP